MSFDAVIVGLAVLAQAEHEEWISGPIHVHRDRVLGTLEPNAAERVSRIGRYNAVESAIRVMKARWSISPGQEGDIAQLLGHAYDRLEEELDSA